MASKNKDKKSYSEAEFKKAMDEFYKLGYTHGTENKKLNGLFPELETQMQITNLAKTLDSNGNRINKEILEQHRNIVNKHMKAFTSDAEKALDEILKAGMHEHKE